MMSRLNPKKVLIIAARLIGGTLINRVYQTWPHSTIHFLGFNEQIDIFKGHPYIDEWISMSKRPSYSEYFTLISRLFRKYDIALVTQPSDRAHLFGLFSANVRFGVMDI